MIFIILISQCFVWYDFTISNMGLYFNFSLNRGIILAKKENFRLSPYKRRSLWMSDFAEKYSFTCTGTVYIYCESRFIPFDFRFLMTGAYCCRDNCFRSLYGSRSSLFGHLPRFPCGGWRSPSELAQYVRLESLPCLLLPSELHIRNTKSALHAFARPIWRKNYGTQWE